MSFNPGLWLIAPTLLLMACPSADPAGQDALVITGDAGFSQDAPSLDAGADADAGAGADAEPADAGLVPDDVGFEDTGLTADAGVDAGALADAGSADSGRPTYGLRFANLSADTLDLCVRPQGSPYAGPMFEASGGVRPNTVSAYVEFDFLSVNYLQKLVPLGATCTTTGTGFNETMQPGNGVKHRTYWYAGRGSPLAGGFFEGPAPTAGKDTLYFTRTQSINARVEFVPNDVSLPHVTLSPLQPTLLDPGVPGQLVGDIPGTGTPPPRPFQAVSDGVLRIVLTATAILVCDDLAPPVGTESDCRPSVRAP